MISPRKTPIAEAEAMYRKHYPERLFVQHLAQYLRAGIVVNLPELFLIGRAVERAAPESAIVNPAKLFPEGDSLFIDMAVGRGCLARLPKIVAMSGRAFKFVCFYRKFRTGLRWYPAEQFLRKVRAV